MRGSQLTQTTQQPKLEDRNGVYYCILALRALHGMKSGLYAAFHWDRELVFTVITRSILSLQTRSKLVNTSCELVILATTSIFVANEINWRETTETKYTKS